MSSYAGRCSTCGGSTAATALAQLLSAVAVGLAVLLFTGLLPKSAIAPYLGHPRWLSELPVWGEEAEPSGESEGVHIGAAPGALPASGYRPQPDRPRRSGGGGGQQPAGPVNTGSREPVPPAAGRNTGAAPASAATRVCDADARTRVIAAAHPSWASEDVERIACGRIRTGFSPVQVEAALGRPSRIDQDTTAGEVTWIYSNATVIFVGGRAVQISGGF